MEIAIFMIKINELIFCIAQKQWQMKIFSIEMKYAMS